MRRQSLLKKLWLGSQTKALAYTQAASGTILFGLDKLNGMFNNETVKGYLSELSLPKEVTIGLVILGIVTYLAHGHGDA